MIDKEYWKRQSPWRNTSFHPEERINNFLDDYESDQKYAVDYAKKMACTDEQVAKIVAKMDRLATEYLTAQSHCISLMITGPARFPVAKAKASSDRCNAKHEAYHYFLTNYEKLIDRWTRPKETQADKKTLWLDKIAKLEKACSHLGIQFFQIDFKGDGTTGERLEFRAPRYSCFRSIKGVIMGARF